MSRQTHKSIAHDITKRVLDKFGGDIKDHTIKVSINESHSSICITVDIKNKESK